MKKRELLARLEVLERQLDLQATRHERQIDKLTLELGSLKRGCGGIVWHARTGTARVLIALSTGHLKGILANMNPSPEVREQVEEEIARRKLDELYRRLELAKGPKACKRLSELISRAGGHLPPELSIQPVGRPRVYQP